MDTNEFRSIILMINGIGNQAPIDINAALRDKSESDAAFTRLVLSQHT